MMNSQTRQTLWIGFGFLGLAVLLGAFGAHGLKNFVTPEKLVTFETGIRYHFYHAFGVVLLGIIQHIFPTLKVKTSLILFYLGILLFSFNCYIYVLTGMKIFAMIVPLGGTSFMLGWFLLAWHVHRFRN
jgi:uncharacterized membrane protein YgdD (TMEM256/DUF423 family)